MPGQVSSRSINANGLIPRATMPPLTSGSPLKVDVNSSSNKSSAAGADLISRVVNQASPNGVGVSIDIVV